MATDTVASPPLHSPPAPGSQPPKPKGILKNAPPPLTTVPSNYSGSHLTWDEANIAETDLSKENFMKITEPKTPYVRYNAELDEVEGMSSIPDFSLTQRSPISSLPPSPHQPASPGLNNSDSPARRTSFGYPSRPSMSASSGSSRSASFSLPGEEGTRLAGGEDGDWGEVEEGEDLDEEAAKKHEEFVKARGRHYSNEAEAMKMARMLPEEDEDENMPRDEDLPEAEASPAPGPNGTSDAASTSSSS